MGTKKSAAPKKLRLNRGFIFIEAPIELVGPQALLWGESAWWPKDSTMQFSRSSTDELGLGSTFKMHLLKPLRQTWVVEVTKFVPGYLIERTFKKGFFEGFEVVRAEERANGTRVEYELHYTIPSPLDMLLWQFVCSKMHDNNIKKVLGALKAFCLKKVAEQEAGEAA